MLPYHELKYFMGMALLEAEKAYREQEVPVAALAIDEFGKLLSKAHNEKESLHDPCAHAEILALRRAGEKRQNWRLLKGTVISTLEPCPMCLGGLLQARVETLVFAAYDLKGGALSLGHDLSFRGKLRIMGGVFQYPSARLLSQFFKEHRKTHGCFREN